MSPQKKPEEVRSIPPATESARAVAGHGAAVVALEASLDGVSEVAPRPRECVRAGWVPGYVLNKPPDCRHVSRGRGRPDAVT